MAPGLVTAPPFLPALRLAGRPGAEVAALAALVDGDPADLASMLEVLAVTDPVARDAAGALAVLPPKALYHGPSAAAVMMPFLCPRSSRFTAGRYGVLYGAESTDTAAAEVSYHHARRLRAAAAPSGTNVVLSLWSFHVGSDVVDLRAHDASIYHPDDYTASQALGVELRDGGAASVLYASVRRVGGSCLGVFIPRVVDHMEKGDDWRLVWNGTTINEVLRVA